MKLHHDPITDTLDISLNEPAENPGSLNVEWIDLMPDLRALVGIPKIGKNVVDPELYLRRNTTIYTIRLARAQERNTSFPLSSLVDQAWQLNIMRSELRTEAAKWRHKEPNLAHAIERITRTPEDRQDEAELAAFFQLRREQKKGAWFEVPINKIIKSAQENTDFD